METNKLGETNNMIKRLYNQANKQGTLDLIPHARVPLRNGCVCCSEDTEECSFCCAAVLVLEMRHPELAPITELRLDGLEAQLRKPEIAKQTYHDGRFWPIR